MRFQVTRHSTRLGYSLHDTSPPPVIREDVEGIGLVEYSPPYRRQSSTFGFYQRKADAANRAALLSQAHQEGRSTKRESNGN